MDHPIVREGDKISSKDQETIDWFVKAMLDMDGVIRSPHFLWAFGIFYETLAVCWLYFKYKLYEFFLLACK